jgi:hypothetical protein
MENNVYSSFIITIVGIDNLYNRIIRLNISCYCLYTSVKECTGDY